MSFHTVYISNPCTLSISRAQLCIRFGSSTEHPTEKTYSVPLEDIATLVLECHQVQISVACLAQLATHGCDVIICNDAHIPVAQQLSFMTHSRQAKINKVQIAWTDEFKASSRMYIIAQKIFNQAHCLFHLTGSTHPKLLDLAKNTMIGDIENNEGRAARYYFNTLLKGSGRKNDALFYNHALNYGYAVIRARISQALTATGFIPSIGLFHRSELNSFNLSDDIIEPFRPFIDYYIFSNFRSDETLETSQKALIIELLETDICNEDAVQTSVNQHILRSVKSLQTAMFSSDAKLLIFPRMSSTCIPLTAHTYE